MKQGLSDTAWASAVQWSRVGIGGIVFLIAARTLPLADIGAFGAAAAPLRLLQVIHKGGIEDAAVTTPPDDAPALAALHRLSLVAAAAATFVTLALAPLLDRLTPGANVALLATALAATSLAHGVAAVPDGILRRTGRFRALALRTLLGQTVAAATGITALALGAGVWSLVIFTLAQATIAALVAIAMVGWPTGPSSSLGPAIARAAPLAARVLAGALVQPLLQVAIGATAGLAAAGVWQIATRVLSLLEAVTLVPLRFVALPRLAADRADIHALLTAAALAATWIMGGTALAAPAMVHAVLGSDGTAVITPLRLLCLTAIAGAGTAMLNQSLIAADARAEVLRIAIYGATAALAFGLGALALAPPDRAATALASSQLVASTVPMALLLAATSFSHLTPILRPWLAFLPMAVATATAGWFARDWPPTAIFTIQALAGTLAFAAALPLILRRRTRS
jgi:O-antigen/teichoic acid export membrane protein